jgi:hypothetical protein
MKREVKQDSFFERLLEKDRKFTFMMKGCKVIDIAPAAAQFHASYSSKASYKAAQGFANVAPPFPAFVMTADCAPEYQAEGWGRSAVIIRARQYDAIDDYDPSLDGGIGREPIMWVLETLIVVEAGKHIAPLPLALNLAVLGDGKIARRPIRLLPLDAISVTDEGGSHRDAKQEDLRAMGDLVMDLFIAPCLFALSLMHCKGVGLKQVVSHQHHSRKVRKRRQSLPKFEHHVIEIRDRHGRVVNHHELQNAMARGLHIVRGHFSTYTENAPLFGRITGTFWIPAHVRGAASEGAISSEYRVSAA